jgi:hypothetical protein
LGYFFARCECESRIILQRSWISAPPLGLGQTGDGRLLPDHLKAQVCRELDRLELLLEQIKAVGRTGRAACRATSAGDDVARQPNS